MTENSLKATWLGSTCAGIIVGLEMLYFLYDHDWFDASVSGIMLGASIYCAHWAAKILIEMGE